MPPDPPREVPPSSVALSVPKKNPTFSQNLIGSTETDCLVMMAVIWPTAEERFSLQERSFVDM